MDRYPSLEQVLAISVNRVLRAPMRASVLRRLERDFAVLMALVPLDTLRRLYRRRLETAERGVVEEIFALARFAAFASEVTLGNRRSRTRSCDGVMNRGEVRLAIEVKHQADGFPFGGPAIMTEDGLEVFEASRPGADHRFLGLAPPDTTGSLPGSSIWREAVAEAIPQLPSATTGLVALSIDGFGDFADDVAAAVYGDEVMVARPRETGFGSNIHRARIPNGVMSSPQARWLAGVWAFQLAPGDLDNHVSVRWGRWYPNPHYVGKDGALVAHWLEDIGKCND